MAIDPIDEAGFESFPASDAPVWTASPVGAENGDGRGRTSKTRRRPGKVEEARALRQAPLRTPTGLGASAAHDICGAMTTLLADMFTLYIKTKSFHWHVSGPHFHDYHLLLDDQAAAVLATTDTIAERVRKLGGTTIRSVGHIGRLQRLADNDAEYVTPLDMLAELRDDNLRLADLLRATHGVCSEHGDVAGTSLLEMWIDEAEQRVWFLYEAGRRGESPGR
jgi:starvation-inducible DNA-binding protein